MQALETHKIMLTLVSWTNLVLYRAYFSPIQVGLSVVASSIILWAIYSGLLYKRDVEEVDILKHSCADSFGGFFDFLLGKECIEASVSNEHDSVDGFSNILILPPGATCPCGLGTWNLMWCSAELHTSLQPKVRNWLQTLIMWCSWAWC